MYKICITNTSKVFINQPPRVICAHVRPLLTHFPWENQLLHILYLKCTTLPLSDKYNKAWMKRTPIITRDIGRHVYHCVSGATITSTRVHWWCRLHQTISSPYLLSEETSCFVSSFIITMNIWCENRLTSDFDILWHFMVRSCNYLQTKLGCYALIKGVLLC